MTKRISIFGSTGSIGQNTLDLVRCDRHLYQVVALTGGKNIEQLVKDAIEFRPEVVVTAYPDLLNALKTGIGTWIFRLRQEMLQFWRQQIAQLIGLCLQ